MLFVSESLFFNFQGNNLIIANLGDSRAILCSRGPKNQLVPVQLTVDLKPNITSGCFLITFRCMTREANQINLLLILTVTQVKLKESRIPMEEFLHWIKNQKFSEYGCLMKIVLVSPWQGLLEISA